MAVNKVEMYNVTTLQERMDKEKTITKAGATSGCFLDLSNPLNGWFNKCHVKVYTLVDISHPLCGVLM